MIDNQLCVSDLGEKKIIKRIINKLDNHEFLSSKKFFEDNIGDDAALINISDLYINNNINDDNKINNKKIDKTYLVASSDLLIQDKHFPKQMSYFQMGKKSVTVNVSDLAAMGSEPVGILISLAIPSDLKLIYFDELIDGILEACYKYKIPLIGGDTNETDQIIVSGTALGIVNENNILKKSKFSNYDYIAITGEIGLVSLGFEILKNENLVLIKNALKNGKINRNVVDLAIKKALNPQAKINEGKILGQFASSATDITDGLASELYEIQQSNRKKNIFDTVEIDNCGLKIYENKLAKMPNFKDMCIIAKILGKDPMDLILHVGEDFEILFTFNSDENEIKNSFKEYMDYYIIGKVTNTNKIEIQYSDGKIRELSPKGYEHFN